MVMQNGKKKSHVQSVEANTQDFFVQIILSQTIKCMSCHNYKAFRVERVSNMSSFNIMKLKKKLKDHTVETVQHCLCFCSNPWPSIPGMSLFLFQPYPSSMLNSETVTSMKSAHPFRPSCKHSVLSLWYLPSCNLVSPLNFTCSRL